MTTGGSYFYCFINLIIVTDIIVCMIKISNKIQHKVRCVFSNGPVPSHTVDTFSYSLSPETTQCCSFD